MEKINLSTPITSYQVKSITLDWDMGFIGIELGGPGGQRFLHEIRGADAMTLMRQLNRANLSTKSLHRYILEKVVADGALQGGVTGMPD